MGGRPVVKAPSQVRTPQTGLPGPGTSTARQRGLSLAARRPREHFQNLLLGLGATVTIVIAWQIANTTGLLPSQVIPPPADVAKAWAAGFGIGSSSSPLAKDLVATLVRLVVGFGSGVIVGVVLGMVAGIWRPVRDFLEPLVATVNVIPAVVTLPVIALWSGVGTETIILVTAYSTVIPIYRGATSELNLSDTKLNWAARSLGASGRRYVAGLLVPLALIGALKNIRVALGYAWRAVIAAEILVVATAGLGSLTFDAHQYGNIATMLAAIVTILLVGLVLDLFAVVSQSRLLERRGLISR